MKKETRAAAGVVVGYVVLLVPAAFGTTYLQVRTRPLHHESLLHCARAPSVPSRMQKETKSPTDTLSSMAAFFACCRTSGSIQTIPFDFDPGECRRRTPRRRAEEPEDGGTDA